MLSVCEVTDIFYLCDEFTKEFESFSTRHRLREDNGKKHRNKPNRISDSEVMTILIAFHLSGMRNLKAYYLFYVSKHMKDEFPKLVSYNRFVELQQRSLLPLVLFLKTCRLGKCTGISFVDSTTLDVCNIKREWQHKVFDGIASKGKSTMGWFFGFKLHLIINDKGEILSFVITQGNVDDRKPLEMESFVKNIFGKLYADRGYISQRLAEILFVDGIHLVYKLKNNMKGELPLKDRIMLRKRAIIESVNDELKNICQIEHTRHRSFANFLTNLIAGLLAYSFLPKKPSIRVDIIEDKQLAIW
ncbi:IS982 family transposase [Dysgonomonas sp. 521]|uniref:IS982 family transposase n=1 Tax=Dysgonomonas sp. 521 TaxID=2302932 RepID=UPI0013D10FA9|nr:IS982 family transposase [Dysgonomonas sp. 521]NDV97646.1 IS982 family transposase [Dysgonomonas sp. 521]